MIPLIHPKALSTVLGGVIADAELACSSLDSSGVAGERGGDGRASLSSF